MTPLQPGQSLTPLVIDAVDPGAMKTMAVLLRDPNPIHWDVAVTRSLGLGDRPVNQGPINMSYLVELAASAAGGRDRIRALSVRFLGNIFAGDRVVCEGNVTSVDEGSGEATLSLGAAVEGVPVLSGAATVALA